MNLILLGNRIFADTIKLSSFRVVQNPAKLVFVEEKRIQGEDSHVTMQIEIRMTPISHRTPMITSKHQELEEAGRILSYRFQRKHGPAGSLISDF